MRLLLPMLLLLLPRRTQLLLLPSRHQLLSLSRHQLLSQHQPLLSRRQLLSQLLIQPSLRKHRLMMRRRPKHQVLPRRTRRICTVYYNPEPQPLFRLSHSLAILLRCTIYLTTIPPPPPPLVIIIPLSFLVTRSLSPSLLVYVLCRSSH